MPDESCQSTLVVASSATVNDIEKQPTFRLFAVYLSIYVNEVVLLSHALPDSRFATSQSVTNMCQSRFTLAIPSCASKIYVVFFSLHSIIEFGFERL